MRSLRGFAWPLSAILLAACATVQVPASSPSAAAPTVASIATPMPTATATPMPTATASPLPSLREIVPLTAPPGVELVERLITYPVSGKTASELRHALDSADVEGMGHPAYTTWDVTWQYRLDPAPDGRCLLSDIQVTVRITTTLPTWDPPAGSDPNLVSRWDRYLNAVAYHESGHAQNGLDAAGSILASLSGQAPADTCESLESVANAAADRIILDAQQTDVEYDAATRHGETTGADLSLFAD